jgi:RND family efflux transporter MFP subunit
MYAYFHLNERDLLQIMQVHRDIIQEKGHDYGVRPDSDLGIPVFLGLANEDDYPLQGVLDFAESRVDTETGTIELRAIFPNQHNPPKLIAGLFTRIRLPVDTDPDALLVSERALSADQSGDYLLVVNKENIVEKRNVIRGQILDGLMAIDKGIQADDRVIINGLQRARPGVKVNPEEAEMTGEPTSIKPPGKNQATHKNLQKSTGNGHPETADKG